MNSGKESQENGIVKENHKKKEESHDGFWTFVIIVAVAALLAFVGSWDQYDQLVQLNQQVESNQSNYLQIVNQIDQEIQVSWEPLILYLPHESEVIVNAMKYRADYKNAINAGDTRGALNAAEGLNSIIQVNALTVNEAQPQQMVSAKLAEKTQTELKDSVGKMSGYFRNWTNAVEKYNSARTQIWGRISVRFWVFVLGGTDLPEKLSYYRFSQTELNVTGTLSRR